MRVTQRLAPRRGQDRELATKRFVNAGCWASVYLGLGDKQKALECGKAPYTLLREFRKERAEKNKEKKGESVPHTTRCAPTAVTKCSIMFVCSREYVRSK